MRPSTHPRNRVGVSRANDEREHRTPGPTFPYWVSARSCRSPRPLRVWPGGFFAFRKLFVNYRPNARSAADAITFSESERTEEVFFIRPVLFFTVRRVDNALERRDVFTGVQRTA